MNALLKMDREIPLDRDLYLTLREKECLEWVSKGKTSLEISIIIGISARTVEVYIARSKKKFNCYSLPSLIYKAVKLGFI